MGLSLNNNVKFACAVLALVFFCEYVIYYVVLLQCLWPQLDSRHVDETVPAKPDAEPVRVMLLADTHLLGSRNGHWFDKLRREWQMYRTFQTAMNIHKPDVVFFLGDLFDEGLWCSEKEFDYYVKRFHDLFYVPKGTQVFVAVGNHDIGFHYGFTCFEPDERVYDAIECFMPTNHQSIIWELHDLCVDVYCHIPLKTYQGLVELTPSRIAAVLHSRDGPASCIASGYNFFASISPYLHERFATAFNAPPVRLVSIKGNHFVLINSMAMEGDGCFLCRPAELQLQRISKRLKCTKGVGKCDRDLLLDIYSRPIVLQHFPMYRESDAICHEPDEAPEEIKTQKFRERWECLSRESSQMLYDYLNPRLVVTGHTHHGCHLLHGKDIHEWTIPSFSWRNKNNPSFMLAVFTPNNYAVSKCMMPQESTIISIYIFGATSIALWIILTYRRFCRRTRWFKRK